MIFAILINDNVISQIVLITSSVSYAALLRLYWPICTIGVVDSSKKNVRKMEKCPLAVEERSKCVYFV